MFLGCQEADDFCIRTFNTHAGKSGNPLTVTKEEMKKIFEEEFKDIQNERDALCSELDENKDGEVTLKEFFKYVLPLYEKNPEFFKKQK